MLMKMVINNINKNIIDYKVIIDNIDDYKNGFGDGVGFEQLVDNLL